MRETWFKEPSSNNEQIIVKNITLTESEPEAQKHWFDQNQKKVQLNPAGVTRFSNASVDAQQIFVTNLRNGTACG